MLRSKSTTTFKHVAPKVLYFSPSLRFHFSNSLYQKKNSKSNLLYSQDATSIDYVSALPELVWLRVAVLLAPTELVKLRALSKKFTKYVNTNLVWASFSWYVRLLFDSLLLTLFAGETLVILQFQVKIGENIMPKLLFAANTPLRMSSLLFAFRFLPFAFSPFLPLSVLT